MKKFLLPGILAAIFLFLPLRSQAVPMDVPYQILISTVSFNGVVVFSTSTFPSGSAYVNSNVANYQWCVEKAVVSAASASNFTMAWSSGTLLASTTDFYAVTAAAVPFDTNFQYRTTYCAPVGQTILNIKDSINTSTMTVEGYLWKGWNP